MSSPTSSLTPEQQALRKQGLGASEVAAVLGLDPYRTALDVYLEKIGEAEPFPGNQFTHWGNKLEPVIAAEYAERHPDATLVESDTVVGAEPWILATPDRIVASPSEKNTWGLECKSRGWFNTDAWGESGTDEVPHAVALQCHWGMFATKLRRWDVAVLLGGNDYREYTLRFDPTIAAEIYARARDFWFDNVIAKVHPPFTGAESDHRFLFKTYPTHTSEMLAATPEMGELAKFLQLERAAIELHDAEKSRLEARLKELIGGALGIEGPFGKITWKHMDAVEVKAFTRQPHRRLTVKFAKALD
jgi:putative phage-type endonuclease